MNELTSYLPAVLTILGSGGAAWASVRASLNGQRQQIRDTRDHVIRIDERTLQMSERLARLEGSEDRHHRVAQQADADREARMMTRWDARDDS